MFWKIRDANRMFSKGLMILIYNLIIFDIINGDNYYVSCGDTTSKVRKGETKENKFDMYYFIDCDVSWVYVSTCYSQTTTNVGISGNNDLRAMTALTCNYNRNARIDKVFRPDTSSPFIKYLNVTWNNQKKYRYTISFYCNADDTSQIVTCGAGSGLNAVNQFKNITAKYSPIDFDDNLITGCIALTHIIVVIFIFFGLLIYYWDILNDVELNINNNNKDNNNEIDLIVNTNNISDNYTCCDECYCCGKKCLCKCCTCQGKYNENTKFSSNAPVFILFWSVLFQFNDRFYKRIILGVHNTGIYSSMVIVYIPFMILTFIKHGCFYNCCNTSTKCCSIIYFISSLILLINVIMVFRNAINCYNTKYICVDYYSNFYYYWTMTGTMHWNFTSESITILGMFILIIFDALCHKNLSDYNHQSIYLCLLLVLPISIDALQYVLVLHPIPVDPFKYALGFDFAIVDKNITYTANFVIRALSYFILFILASFRETFIMKYHALFLIGTSILTFVCVISTIASNFAFYEHDRIWYSYGQPEIILVFVYLFVFNIRPNYIVKIHIYMLSCIVRINTL